MLVLPSGVCVLSYSYTYDTNRDYSSFRRSVAVLRGGQVACPHCENCASFNAPTHNKISCKVGRLHNSCIHSITSQIRSAALSHTLCHPEFFPPLPPNTDMATTLANPNCCSYKRPKLFRRGWNSWSSSRVQVGASSAV